MVIDGNGRVVSSATEEHQPFASPQIGWAEQTPEDWWRASCIAVRKAIASANLGAEEIACVGFSGQMHGAVMLNEQGSVVRPALIWCDVRTEKTVPRSDCQNRPRTADSAHLQSGGGASPVSEADVVLRSMTRETRFSFSGSFSRTHSSF